MNPSASNTLVLLTLNYPYGNSENFLEVELPVLAQHFDRVIVIPWDKAKGEREVPSNVEIISKFIDQPYQRSNAIKGNLRQILSLIWQEIRFNKIKQLDLKSMTSTLLRLSDRALNMEKYFASLSANTTYYSYWFDNGATVLSILKSKGIINNYVSRAHGFDLYEERNEKGSISFRRFQLEHISKLVLISKDGLDYIAKRYPKYRDKYVLSYLGSLDYGFEESNRSSDVLRIVTASRMVPVKRLHLIIESLMLVNRPIEWFHFGDGPLEDKLKESAKMLPNNVKYSFVGQKENRELLSFLKSGNIDLFLNVSESEGLPVTIMEAISFGIPVFATDVGGTREEVTPKTGVLFPVDFSSQQLANAIDDYEGFGLRSIEHKRKIRDFWAENFMATKNYKKMCDLLDSI